LVCTAMQEEESIGTLVHNEPCWCLLLISGTTWRWSHTLAALFPNERAPSSTHWVGRWVVWWISSH
jgi:hypothetical protein